MCPLLGPPFQPGGCREMGPDAIEFLKVSKLLGEKLGLECEERMGEVARKKAIVGSKQFENTTRNIKIFTKTIVRKLKEIALSDFFLYIAKICNQLLQHDCPQESGGHVWNTQVYVYMLLI